MDPGFEHKYWWDRDLPINYCTKCLSHLIFKFHFLRTFSKYLVFCEYYQSNELSACLFFSTIANYTEISQPCLCFDNKYIKFNKLQTGEAVKSVSIFPCCLRIFEQFWKAWPHCQHRIKVCKPVRLCSQRKAVLTASLWRKLECRHSQISSRWSSTIWFPFLEIFTCEVILV